MNMKLFSGSSNPDLTAKICQHLGIAVGKIHLKSFPSGEKYCQYEENIRGGDIFLVQSTNKPANDNLMELLVMADAARRASAGRLTAVIPYYGYSRQERKEKSRVPISARLVMDLLESSGFNRLLTMDLHAPQIVGFTNLPVDHLLMKPALVDSMRKVKIDVIVAPDIGAVKRAEELARGIGKDMAIISKKRLSETKVETSNFIGDVKGQNVLITDDLTESAGTLIEAATTCKSQGAVEINCAISHGCFTDIGVERLVKAFKDKLINRVFVSNSVKFTDRWIDAAEPQDEDGTVIDWAFNHIETVDVSSLFATAIKNIHNNESVSALFS